MVKTGRLVAGLTAALFDPDLNLELLQRNEYFGRCIFAARVKPNLVFDGAIISGRSEDSQNRRLVMAATGDVWTEVANENMPPKDPKMTIYPAMQSRARSLLVVGNGNQTNDAMRCGGHLDKAMQFRTYEPGGTPRITATVRVEAGKPCLEMSILRKSLLGDGCDKVVWRYNEWLEDAAYCLTTYEGNGDPLPSFSGQPYLLRINGGGVKALTYSIWDGLATPHKVAMVGRLTNIETFESKLCTINLRKKVKARGV